MKLRAIIPVLLCCSLVVSAICLAPSASAQRNPLSTGSYAEVREGEDFTYDMFIQVDSRDTKVKALSIAVPPGVTQSAKPSYSYRTEVRFENGQMIRNEGVTVSWTLRADKPGTYTVGPGKCEVAGELYEGEERQIQVVSQPVPTQPSFDPFQPLIDLLNRSSGGFPGIPGIPGISGFPKIPGFGGEPLVPTPDPALALSTAPHSRVFLRALTDKTSAVVGEQVTFSVYEYYETSGYRRSGIHEAPLRDFLQYPVLDPTADTVRQYAEVGSRTWRVRLIRKIALFPLQVGKLSTGSMQVEYTLGVGTQELMRNSNPVQINVTEPPTKGRPAGFRAGDVGQFKLRGSVSPRTVDAGGAVEAVLTVAGTGNLPSSLPTQSSKTVQWLDPEVREDIDADNGVIKGSRTFKYVVQLPTAGDVDLGSVRLVYYDPVKRHYNTAEAALGTVKVLPVQDQAMPEVKVVDRFALVAEPRQHLSSYTPRKGYITDHVGYWIALFALPFAVVIGQVGWFVSRKARASMVSWRNSWQRQIAAAQKQAQTHLRNKDTAEAAACVEKAIHLMIESATGIKSRAVLRDQLAERLLQAGVLSQSADEAVEILQTCESLRYNPELGEHDMQQIIDRAHALSRRFGATRAKSKGAQRSDSAA